jgi:hypothetical protein
MPRQQADAILDRVIHDAYGIELAGPLEYTGTHDPCMLPDSAVADILFS